MSSKAEDFWEGISLLPNCRNSLCSLARKGIFMPSQRQEYFVSWNRRSDYRLDSWATEVVLSVLLISKHSRIVDKAIAI